jgi:hypothetical protein
MINIVNGLPVEFNDFKFEADHVRNMMNNYVFSNNRAITKAMLTWWAFEDDRQELLSLETTLETEHIYARNRQDKEKSLSNKKNLEALGNKSLLEKKINIRASDYRFADKIKYYIGYENSRKQKKDGTKIIELLDFARNKTDFVEADIEKRNHDILEGFIRFLREQNLVK